MYLCFSNIMMCHVFIQKYKPKSLHQVLIDFNLYNLFYYLRGFPYLDWIFFFLVPKYFYSLYLSRDKT